LSALSGNDDDATNVRSMDKIIENLKVSYAVFSENDITETNQQIAIPCCAQSSCKDVPFVTRSGENSNDGWQVSTERRLGSKLGLPR
jgi:hypothetical protein